ncbi:serine/threonine-protein kinase [Polyangium sp. y55x31]|uniref:serine/threonine-protein kinase n=1 Tax=Polyangium sp. y55x31 TaxID=3042688 RepID=UPI0024825318|nr:serine/threonine-protein kinase [Polyangium sp. y55x31]MDI1483596.1 serine/threonine-protein kinase [Polyangium sp. y55x31]
MEKEHRPEGGAAVAVDPRHAAAPPEREASERPSDRPPHGGGPQSPVGVEPTLGAAPAAPSEGAPHPRGARVGSYVLQEELARGGFGVVYRANHAEHGSPGAVKVLHGELVSHANAPLRFAREVELIRNLRHPNVVHVLEQGQLEDGRPYFTMELLSGMTLKQQLMLRGRLSPAEVLSILEPVASALDAAHALGIVHRDVKPSNIFVCADGRVVLLDFGVAKLLDNNAGPALTGSRQVVGTVHYMAPEQSLGRLVDARADVFSLGIIAYVLLTGSLPYGAEASPLARQVLLHARPARPSSLGPVDPAFDEPVLGALSFEPEGRPHSASAFVAELQAAAQRARHAQAQPDGGLERPALAAYAEVFVDAAELEDPDDALLTDLEGALSFVSAQLSEAGLIAVMETGNNLLMVAEEPPDAALSTALRRNVLERAIEAGHRLSTRPSRDPRVRVALVLHAGHLRVSSEGTLQGGGLLEPSAWVPAAVREGVMASSEITQGLSMQAEPLPDVPSFLKLV